MPLEAFANRMHVVALTQSSRPRARHTLSRRGLATLAGCVLALIFAGGAHAQFGGLPNDDLLGYKAKIDKKAVPPGTAFPKGVQRTIVDQFGSHGVCAIKKERTTYNPASTNGSTLKDPSRYYVGYGVACEQKLSETHTFFSEIHPAGISVLAVKERSILVPAGQSTFLGADPTPPAFGTNHYLCYKAKAEMTPVVVDVDDDVGNLRPFELTKIAAVCNPADKDGNDPTAATDPDHYVCYKAKRVTKVAAPTVRTNNFNFDGNTLARKAETELCYAAFKDDLPPTTTTTMGSCSGGPFSCGGTCPAGLTCAPVGDFPPYCGCIPDGSQPCESVDWPYCGGVCPPGETCGSVAHVPGGACICVPTGMPACGESPFPTCGGACLGGEACYAFRVGSYEFCGCSAVGACATECGTYPPTGGQCLPGEVCTIVQGVCGCGPD